MFYVRLEQGDMLLCFLSCYICELFPSLQQCWGRLYLITLLRCSQSWNIADVYPHLLHCWAVPNLKTLLLYSVCYYMAELYPILVHWRTMVYLNTFLWFSRNVVGSRSEASITSPKSREICRLRCRFLSSMVCWSKTTCCCFICLVTMLSCFPSYKVADAYFILLVCWDVPNLETLLTNTLTCYIAELFPIL